ncbi:hypothetical protein [Microbispora sp. NPDC046933]|uniref:hypothetical protein n=1 Tax=Microbispora sp. NPDC046933 TaxID=3155618 RepID=UPI0033D8C73E
MKRLPVLLTVAALAATSLTGLSGGPAAAGTSHTSRTSGTSGTSPGPLAEGDVVYQVLVDRFSNGSTANDDSGHGEYDRPISASTTAATGPG